ncbi:MAG: sodium-translocating pyrophosphatase [Candidatus Ancillula sp.]|jgi:K(+)-stimulated pyrophosphate-energized sodium pump|nr:sodium-translocating pyrophosphatase [Candidatus Ancillula sp.]
MIRESERSCSYICEVILFAYMLMLCNEVGERMTHLIWLAPVAGAISIIFAGLIAANVLKSDKGDEKMQEIAAAIQEGAMAYLNKQYTIIAIVAVILAVPIALKIGINIAIGFLLGAIFSGLAGYIGMNVSVRANVRTAAAAKTSLKDALNVAFRGGSVTGLAVVGLSMLGVSIVYIIFRDVSQIVGFGFGASLISLFARVGGGIFTKAADVGADIVGKVEAGIPEDDPRNPATIADNVGDNVGDCAGMGADLFETYAVTLIASMLIGATIAIRGGITNKIPKGAANLVADFASKWITYPLLLGSAAIIASIVAVFAVRLGKKNNIMAALYKGVGAAAAICAVAFLFITKAVLGDLRYYWVSLIGIAITVLMVIVTEYYTGTKYRPVKEIAAASETGAGTNVISGLSFGFESTIVPVVIIIAGILGAFALGGGSIANPLGGLYAIAIAAVSMLSTTGMIVALDSYGPITDNAGGIAEMSEQNESVRSITDQLDAVGNTTKAVTKGYAIGSAALGALALFAEFHDKVITADAKANFSIDNPLILVGLLIGGVLPFAFTSVTMRAVSKAASAVVVEVRRQFKEIPGILEGKNKPEYGKCVSIVTTSALKQMIVPGLIAVVVPVLVGLIFGSVALAGTLIGIIVVGLMLAMTLNNAGGAWDNAKKVIETDGLYGGKGSEAHKAAVVGDTVGDPTKDTSGPGLNALIKVVNMIAILTIALYATGGVFHF